MAVTLIGGLPVDEAGDDGAQVVTSGQLQYGSMLMGAGTSAGWRELVGWRDTPQSSASDSPRPQAHGTYPGDVLGDSIVVTYKYLLRGTPEDKMAAIAAIEQYAPLDSVDRFLTVDDGDGPWFRMARVIGRSVPQAKHFRHGPAECSLQFLCADPRRYSLAAKSGSVSLPESTDGLVYPLVYPLEYGTSASGSFTVSNVGSAATPLIGQFVGPLTDPVVTTPGWQLGFDLVLAAGETLDVDASEGTALLNGTADRLYTIKTDSDPLEACFLPVGSTSLVLSAPSGTGTFSVNYRDARL